MFWLRSHVLTVSKTSIFTQEQVEDKKITGFNGSHFLYLCGDFIKNGHFQKTESRILKICQIKKSKNDQGSIFDSRKLKLGKKILPGDS